MFHRIIELPGVEDTSKIIESSWKPLTGPVRWAAFAWLCSLGLNAAEAASFIQTAEHFPLWRVPFPALSVLHGTNQPASNNPRGLRARACSAQPPFPDCQPPLGLFSAHCCHCPAQALPSEAPPAAQGRFAQANLRHDAEAGQQLKEGLCAVAAKHWFQV